MFDWWIESGQSQSNKQLVVSLRVIFVPVAKMNECSWRFSHVVYPLKIWTIGRMSPVNTDSLEYVVCIARSSPVMKYQAQAYRNLRVSNQHRSLHSRRICSIDSFIELHHDSPNARHRQSDRGLLLDRSGWFFMIQRISSACYSLPGTC